MRNIAEFQYVWPLFWIWRRCGGHDEFRSSILISFEQGRTFTQLGGSHEGMEAEQQKQNRSRGFGIQPGKKTGPGRMAQTPRAVKSDSIGRFHRYWCSTLFNSDCNLYLRSTSLIKLLPPLENCRLLPTPKQTHELNLSAITSGPNSLRCYLLHCTPTGHYVQCTLWRPVCWRPKDAGQHTNIEDYFHPADPPP